MSVCLYVCMSVCLYVFMYVCMHVCMYVHIYIYIYTYMHTYIYIYIYIHMYICICGYILSCHSIWYVVGRGPDSREFRDVAFEDVGFEQNTNWRCGEDFTPEADMGEGFKTKAFRNPTCRNTTSLNARNRPRVRGGARCRGAPRLQVSVNIYIYIYIYIYTYIQRERER